MTTAVPDAAQSLCSLLDMVRSGSAVTRPELAQQSGLGRRLITQRLNDLIELGLVEEGELAASTGGRAARTLRFRTEAGRLLVAELGSSSLGVGIADLGGNMLTHREAPTAFDRGPDEVLSQVEQLFEELLATQPSDAPPVWGIGIGVLGPVDARTGCPMPVNLFPGWGGYPVRDRLSTRYDVPVWVDNEVNLMALGEYHRRLPRRTQNLAYLKIGTGIGAGLISDGRLLRGFSGSAGQIGHVSVVDDPETVCWCGSTGCLVLFAGGRALSETATELARSGRSDLLARRLEERGVLSAQDISDGAQSGDPECSALLIRTGKLIGKALATLVNVANPELVLIGGSVADTGETLLAGIREEVYRLSFPPASHHLSIVHSTLIEQAGLIGAADMVVDELLSLSVLPRWIDSGSPAGRATRIHG
ncbi:ROK family protein [Streptomyces sp. NPDC091215]|uniref:ROK family protein n=1 Tax=Streptomyces sp. NPDC091215 TaxID=3155192 RepID=UPI003433DF6C